MNIKTEKTYDIFALDAYLEKPTYNMNEHLDSYVSEISEVYSNVFKDINGYRPKYWPNGTSLENLNELELMLKQLDDDIEMAYEEMGYDNE